MAVCLAAAAAGCRHAAAPPAPLAESFATDASLLEFPRGGGTAVLRSPDRLLSRRWEIGGVPGIARTLGTDLDAQMVYAVSRDGRLVALDLLARRVRVFPNHLHDLAGTADGVVIGLDSARRPMRLANRTMTVFHASVRQAEGTLLPGPGTAVVAVDNGVGQVIDEQGVLRQVHLPAGPATTDWYGDMIAVTTDSGVVLVNPSGKTSPLFVPVRGTPTAATFSPSGHQLYVARHRGDLLVLDRFGGDKVGSVALPITANALRVDRTGRWLLAGGAGRDSVAVVDLATSRLMATVAAPWGADLPLVPDGKTLVIRRGADVVALSLADSLAELGRITGGASSEYLAVAWSPQLTMPEISPQVLATMSPRIDTAPRGPARHHHRFRQGRQRDSHGLPPGVVVAESGLGGGVRQAAPRRRLPGAGPPAPDRRRGIPRRRRALSHPGPGRFRRQASRPAVLHPDTRRDRPLTPLSFGHSTVRRLAGRPPFIASLLPSAR